MRTSMVQSNRIAFTAAEGNQEFNQRYFLKQEHYGENLKPVKDGVKTIIKDSSQINETNKDMYVKGEKIIAELNNLIDPKLEVKVDHSFSGMTAISGGEKGWFSILTKKFQADMLKEIGGIHESLPITAKNIATRILEARK